MGGLSHEVIGNEADIRGARDRVKNRMKQTYSNYLIFITLSYLYYLLPMPNPTDRFQWLTQQWDALVERLHVAHDLEERRMLLRRMKVLITEIDMLIASTLKRDAQDITVSPPDRPRAES